MVAISNFHFFRIIYFHLRGSQRQILFNKYEITKGGTVIKFTHLQSFLSMGSFDKFNRFRLLDLVKIVRCGVTITN